MSFALTSPEQRLRRFYLPVILTTIFILGYSTAMAQQGFRPGDVVTYADSRDVTGVDFTPREVIFATNGGLCRFDRISVEPLEPEFCGYGSGTVFQFGRISALLYHHESASLWISTDNGLFVRQHGLDNWRDMGSFYRRADRLGEKNDTLYIQIDSEVFGIAVFGYQALGKIENLDDTDIRWSFGKYTRNSSQSLPFYFSVDPYLRFDPDKGRLVDWDLTSYSFSFFAIDEEYGKRYIGFPGLGFGIADERRGSIDIFQPGPAGGVKAIVIGEDGLIVTGGSNHGKYNGLNSFDRSTGKWDRLGRKQRWGYETTTIYDLALVKDRLYAATEEGLLSGALSQGNWSIQGFLDGTPQPPLTMIELIGERLFIGGRDGMRQMGLPKGPFFDIKGTGKSEIYAVDGVAEGDTLWVAGEQGIIKGGEKGNFEYIKGEDIFTDSPAQAIAVTSRTVAIGGFNGLGLFGRKSRSWKSMPSSAHLNGGQVLSLAARKQDFYIGTDRGLFYYNDKTGKMLPFGLEMGLPSLRVEELLIEKDTLWVGTSVGLTKISLNADYWK